MHFPEFERVSRGLSSAIILLLLSPAWLFGQDQRIEIMDVNTGHHFTLDPKSAFDAQGSATFSPDQQWVAFDGSRKGQPFSKKRLFITKADGSQQEPTNLVNGAMPSFSKDGKRIAYSSPEGGVWVMDVDGENKTEVDEGGWAICFSPRDNHVVAYQVYAGSRPNIQVHNLKTNQKRLLLSDETSAGYWQIFWNFTWSNDGSQIVFVGRTQSEVKQGVRKSDFLVVATVGTGKDHQHEIVTVENAHCRVLFHPTKHAVFYSTRSASKGTHRIFSIDLDVPQKFRVPVYLASQPEQRMNKINDFSSDGNLIALVSKPMPTDSATDFFLFDTEIRPTLAAVANLKRAESSLRQQDYETFVDVLMGDINQSNQKLVAEKVKSNATKWLATVNDALSQADEARHTGDSVVIPINKGSENLMMVQIDGQWRLADSQRPKLSEPAKAEAR